MPETPREKQLLLIDADDTLWENNKYFERAIDGYMALLASSGWDRVHIRQRINHEERRAIAEAGYGLKSFVVALTRAWQALLHRDGEPAPEAVRERIQALAAQIAEEPIEFLPDTVETLRYLAPRHRLVLFTKGDYAEQTRKVALAGVAPLFEHVEVVPEKEVTVYRAALRRWRPEPGQAWMIGNSPRSDINPAMAAGMNAVFIPHPQTWVLEHDAIVPQPGCELLELRQFAELREYF